MQPARPLCRVDNDDARNHRALTLRSGISGRGAAASCEGGSDFRRITEAVDYLSARVAYVRSRWDISLKHLLTPSEQRG